MAAFNSIEEVHAFLNSIPMFQDKGLKAARFGLDGIRALLQGMGNPHEGLKIIHVAGTNGKGSVCYLLHAVYSNAGYTTGMYTSPHLSRYSERFVVNGDEISDDLLLAFFNAYAGLIEEQRPTYFEISTALAFWFFRQRGTDIAIIETGLGGRLDATNVVNPLVSVITSIGFDHTDVLGSEISGIAAEKAGIIKPGKPVVIGRLSEEAVTVIHRRAASLGSDVYRPADPEPLWDKGKVGLPGRGEPLWIETGFIQPVQRYNVAMVCCVTDILSRVLPIKHEQTALAIFQTSQKGSLPGRFERMMAGHDFYFDGAHNTEAFAEAFKLLDELAAGRKKILVFSIMRDKLTNDMLSIVSQFDELYYLESNMNRAALYQEVCALVPNLKRFNEENWVFYQKLFISESAVTLFSGSFYFYRRVLDMFQRTQKTSSQIS